MRLLNVWAATHLKAPSGYLFLVVLFFVWITVRLLLDLTRKG
jgi:hypothetical protein